SCSVFSGCGRSCIGEKGAVSLAGAYRQTHRYGLRPSKNRWKKAKQAPHVMHRFRLLIIHQYR
ncbi:hypothetical protein EAY34_23790, partial [Escherichia coli]|nr:hypothetical protein [Escherichia coli]